MQNEGFDNEQYLKLQSSEIKRRIADFGGKLYLEFGGKLFDDYHASRVLPGFQPDSKAKMLMELRDEAELIIVISADDIEKNKRRGDFGITYDLDALRLIDAFHDCELYVGSVVITKWHDQPAAVMFKKRLEAQGVTVYRHYPIQDYPANIPLIVSDEGFGKNEYIKTSRSLIILTGPGPGSGKMATALSQLYHEHKHGVDAGFSKFETFPTWNLPLNHPLNLAYEAATADLADVNMIDPFHLEAYGITAVNYNRDIEIFPVVCAMLEKISGSCPYKSPTDMGVNMVGFCITDDEAVRNASKQEIIRRYYAASCAQKEGLGTTGEIYRLELLMNRLGISSSDRPVVEAALKRAEETGEPATAISLRDGRVITGRTGDLLGASSACLLNALKELAGIDDEVKLISPEILEPVTKLKLQHMGNRNPRLHTDEVLLALSICAATDPIAALAMEKLPELFGCEAHTTVILSKVDENIFQKLGINTTSEPQYQTSKLYRG
ncbi:DUF1846 domain-containing protein [Clostridiaceae bacterium OttesenSCG-928-D20]|nr:DUF1846 domain-containing protein [Clostridiaceae bacterium OttesenSCG-928-D20]